MKFFVAKILACLVAATAGVAAQQESMLFGSAVSVQSTGDILATCGYSVPISLCGALRSGSFIASTSPSSRDLSFKNNGDTIAFATIEGDSFVACSPGVDLCTNQAVIDVSTAPYTSSEGDFTFNDALTFTTDGHVYACGGRDLCAAIEYLIGNPVPTPNDPTPWQTPDGTPSPMPTPFSFINFPTPYGMVGPIPTSGTVEPTPTSGTVEPTPTSGTVEPTPTFGSLFTSSGGLICETDPDMTFAVGVNQDVSIEFDTNPHNTEESVYQKLTQRYFYISTNRIQDSRYSTVTITTSTLFTRTTTGTFDVYRAFQPLAVDWTGQDTSNGSCFVLSTSLDRNTLLHTTQSANWVKNPPCETLGSAAGLGSSQFCFNGEDPSTIQVVVELFFVNDVSTSKKFSMPGLGVFIKAL